jgi:alpha-L-rhamnosidase
MRPGRVGTAYQLLLSGTAPSWLTMVDRGATTLWEVASFLHRYVAGLRPTAPGYRTFEVRPRPGGGISFATARHISPFGPIEVSWRLHGGPAELELLVPPGTTASVILPGENPRRAGPGRHHWTGASS